MRFRCVRVDWGVSALLATRSSIMGSIYTDVLTLEDARGVDAVEISEAPAFDYDRQEWTTSDHAHLVGWSHTEADSGPLALCGATWSSCKRADHDELARRFLAEREGFAAVGGSVSVGMLAGLALALVPVGLVLTFVAALLGSIAGVSA